MQPSRYCTMELTESGWYDDEITGGYRWYSGSDQTWTMFTAPGLADKAVKVATGTAATKIFFYTTLLLWGVLRAPEYVFPSATLTLKPLTDVSYVPLVIFAIMYYPVIHIYMEVARRTFLRELEKAIGFVIDSPPSRPPTLWLISKEYLSLNDKVATRKAEKAHIQAKDISEGQATVSKE